MNTQELQSEFHRVMKLFLGATHDFRERISAAEPELAVEWEHDVREALVSLERLVTLLLKVYSLPPEEGANARKELVDHAAGEFGEKWRRHMTRLEERVDARYPEPPDPE